MRKRIVSFVLAAVMCIGMLPTAFAASASRFEDVTETAWYLSAVNYVVEHGLFSGTGDATFSPEDTMTRAMFVTVLARMNGVNNDDIFNSGKFSDIDFASWYGPSVIWASENGYINGTSDNEFSPNMPINREQIAVILHRYLHSFGVKVPVADDYQGVFTDRNDISTYAGEAVEMMRIWGFVKGNNGAYQPKRSITRAEAATILMRVNEFLKEAPIGENSKINVINVTLNRKSLTMTVGDTFQVCAFLFPSNATNKKIKWTSSKSEVASVDENGNVTALKPGTTSIVASTDFYMAINCDITVADKNGEIKPELINFEDTMVSMKVGKTHALKYKIFPESATNKSVEFTSSDTSVVTVNGNIATAVGAGKATITAEISNGWTTTCGVMVVEDKAGGFTVASPNFNHLDEFVFSTSIYDTDDNRYNTSKIYFADAVHKGGPYLGGWAGVPQYDFKSSDERVATVDESGVVTATLMQPGEEDKQAIITVTSKDTGESAQLKVTVKELVYYEEDDPEYFERYRDEMLRIINEAREAEGLNPLKYAYGLQSYADARAKDLKVKFSHIQSNGEQGPGAENIRIGALGGRFSEPNLRRTSVSPEELATIQMRGWMGSKRHRANILLEYTNYAVFGLYIEDNWAYGSQNFMTSVSTE